MSGLNEKRCKKLLKNLKGILKLKSISLSNLIVFQQQTNDHSLSKYFRNK
jgi:hypothetical protein